MSIFRHARRKLDDRRRAAEHPATVVDDEVVVCRDKCEGDAHRNSLLTGIDLAILVPLEPRLKDGLPIELPVAKA